MEKLTIEILKKNNLIAYEYVRGSNLYNTALPDGKSDIDIGGVYILPNDYLLGLPENYTPQVSDETNDTTYYELGRWVELLMKCNPTAIESLFVPEDKIIGPVHPSVQIFIDNRDMFLTKEIFKTNLGFAYNQVKRARGLNKKIVNPITERKTVLDFCYVPYNQGTKHVEKWLADNGLKQKYCALVPLPNMHDVYGLYYDFGTHIICEYGIDLRCGEDLLALDKVFAKAATKETFKQHKLFAQSIDKYCEYNSIYDIVPSGYHGIVSENSESNDVRHEAVPKGKTPIIIMSFNKDGYTVHCKKYKEYKEWEAKRNPVRYESNLHKNYDSKNIYHTIRLIHMSKELAENKGFNIVRTWDRDFLIDIRNHKFEYDYIMDYANNVYNETMEKINDCKLPETVDKDKVNDLLIQARKMYN